MPKLTPEQQVLRQAIEKLQFIAQTGESQTFTQPEAKALILALDGAA